MSDIEKIIKIFIDYATSKKYDIKRSSSHGRVRLDISNFKETTIINIFPNRHIQIQGKSNSLQREFIEFDAQISSDPSIHNTNSPRACSTTYTIVSADMIVKIQKFLYDTPADSIKIIENPNENKLYTANIGKNNSSLTITQFKNGTLFLQGKEDLLFDEYCTLIESIAQISEKEIILRFLSGDEVTLKEVSERYTPELITQAERKVRGKLSVVFDYLESHDQKYIVATECLCLSKIPLPEYSALVMPASKAFEGFSKKLLVDLGIVPSTHFSTPSANFQPLNDPKNSGRIAICLKEKYADKKLKDLSISIDKFRNFMMHSDSSPVTKVDSQADAEKKISAIYDEMIDKFEYFNSIVTLI
jgi:hypothetical protein